ncbi:hypothetical protein [Caballeronia concitans]|uniref:Uncharacterized protein n=1 Tax=Caballeronia concitans TaxID=1777133 RepID=A0A658R1T3_9BURK|nr:hypothetical protein [Caballeronia concitans]KIG08658.1 hypothetical protein BurMR1_0322 [Burkholderia sp. MR1]SAL40644.1 hypothetical protein AWB72_04267 [Caballeronia concitans]
MSTTQAYDGLTTTATTEGTTEISAQPPVEVEATRAAASARSSAEQRFKTALACLGAAYALSWAELGLSIAMGFPGDAASHPVAASVVSRVLLGLLYLCVASRFQWARWLTVALGLVSVALVAPTLAMQWHVFPSAAVLSGAMLACRLAASLLLLSPMPSRKAAYKVA